MKARPDVEAAVRGGDWDQPMNGEGPIGDATIKQALYWRQICSKILAMEAIGKRGSSNSVALLP